MMSIRDEDQEEIDGLPTCLVLSDKADRDKADSD